ncbi:MAG: extracellular solute-binding protein [Pseudomonadota bacterium]|nr:extracellular solute-binding protein [Pseudomonadota bacterium]
MNDGAEGGNPKSGTPALTSGLSRRALLGRAAALGISSTMIGAFLSSYCASTARAQGTGAFDPKKYAGTQLSILMTGDENDHRALVDLLPQLEEETGIQLEITSPALGPLIEKTLQNLKAERSSFDLINYLGFLTTQQVGGGYYEKLNSYIENPEETPPDWDFADFLPPAMKNVAIYDVENHGLGQGSDVYGIPGFHSGSVIYFYRKDLFDAAGLQPAKTWDEFKAAAAKLHSEEVAGCSFIGANDFSLATVDWYTRFITIGGKLMSGDPNGKDFRPNVDSPEGVRALQMLIDLLPYAPKNVTQYGFAENVDGFSTGKIAQMIFWATIAGPILDPEDSLVADKTGTASVPADPGQTPRAIQGGWGIGIPKNSDPAKKTAAWRALTWITSKEMNRYSVEKYQIDANRVSTFKDPDLVAQFPYLPVALQAAETAETIPTSLIDEFFQLNDVMNVEFNKALIGGQDAKTACANVQQQWEGILRKAGRLI